MLSRISKGVGHWDGATHDESLFTNCTTEEQFSLDPLLHRHGVTVNSNRKRKKRVISVEEVDGFLEIPKTYLTRKGALVLYSSNKPANTHLEKPSPFRTAEKLRGHKTTPKLEDTIARLGNVRHLMASILFMNDEEISTTMSISDERNEIFLGFLRSLDSVLQKHSMRPGCDLSYYLKALRGQASKLASVAGTEFAEQVASMLHPSPSRPSTSGSVTRPAKIALNSAQLAASVKSRSYLGRRIDFNVLQAPEDKHTLSAMFEEDREINVVQRASTNNKKLASPGVTDLRQLDPHALSPRPHSSPAALHDAGSIDHGLAHSPTIGIDADVSNVNQWLNEAVDRDTPGTASTYNDRHGQKNTPAPRSPTIFVEPPSSVFDKDKISQADEGFTVNIRKGDNVKTADSYRRSARPKSARRQALENKQTPNDVDFSSTTATTPLQILIDTKKSSTHRTHPYSTDSTLETNELAASAFGSDELAASGLGSDGLAAGGFGFDGLAADGLGSDELAATGFGSDELAATGFGSDGLAAGGFGSDELAATGFGSDGAGKQEEKTIETINNERDETAPGNSFPVRKSQMGLKKSNLEMLLASSVNSNFALTEKTSTSEIVEDTIGSSNVSATSERAAGLQTAVSANSSRVLKEKVTTLPNEGSERMTTNDGRLKDSLLVTKRTEMDSLRGGSTPQPLSRRTSSSSSVGDKLSFMYDEMDVRSVSSMNSGRLQIQTDSQVGVANQSTLSLPMRPSGESVPRQYKRQSTLGAPPKPVPQSASTIDGKSQLTTATPKVPEAEKTQVESTSSGQMITPINSGPGIEISRLSTRDPVIQQPSVPVYRIPTDIEPSQVLIPPEDTGEQRRVSINGSVSKRTRKQSTEAKPLPPAEYKPPKEVTDMLNDSMFADFVSADQVEGLTVDEMELVKLELAAKMEVAHQSIAESFKDQAEMATTTKVKRRTSRAKKGSTTRMEDNQFDSAKNSELEMKRKELREAKKLQKQQQIAEKQALQEEIAKKSRQLYEAKKAEEAKLRDLEDEADMQKRIAEEIRRQEEDARVALALTQKQSRDERERRRREELEKRKEAAIRRKSSQKSLMDGARKKELEMLEKIADAESMRRLREEERRKKDDEEWQLERQLMEEERRADLAAAEEEERIARIEKEAEEAALTRLVEERMEAEEMERELMEKRRELLENERREREKMEAEERGMAEQLKKKELEEIQQIEEEQRKIGELKRLQRDAQERLLTEIEEKKKELLRLRELNLEKKHHLATIKQNQAFTKSWVFSYYLDWPRETYERLMGMSDKKRTVKKK